MSGIVGLLESIGGLLMYLLFFYIFHVLWKKIRNKESYIFPVFFAYFFKRAAIMMTILFSILWGFSYYYNEVSPAPMPQYILSNGKTQVVFQAMSHIGTQKFYDTIVEELRKKKKQWYVYYFEWVRQGTLENQKSFNTAIGIKFDKDLYKNFSKLYWVVQQDNSLFLHIVNNKDYNIDLSIDEIMNFYHAKKSAEKTLKKNSQWWIYHTEVVDASAQILEILSTLNTRELLVLQYINKAFLNGIISSSQLQNTMMTQFGNKKLFDVILGKRNELLAQKILSWEHEKIFITYGLLHFQWVLDILKKSDSRWKVEKVNYTYPIQ